MSADYLVIAHFSSIEATRSAIRELRNDGFDEELELYSPFPEHSLEEELYRGKRRSPVRLVTLLGGISGVLLAFLFTSWMSIDYPLRVSAKPLISIPAFIIIGFECLILIGASSAVFSMFHFSRIPNWFFFPAYRPEFSEGTFGLCVRVSKESSNSLKTRLASMEAEKVEVQYVR